VAQSREEGTVTYTSSEGDRVRVPRDEERTPSAEIPQRSRLHPVGLQQDVAPVCLGGQIWSL
jgi:hypothetical protein